MQVAAHPLSPEDLMAYLDGETPSLGREDAARHLEKCKSCQNLAADLQSVSRELRGWSVEPGTDEMPLKLAQALAQVRTPPKFSAPFMVSHRAILLLASAAVIAIAVLVFKPAPVISKRKVEVSHIPPSLFDRAGMAAEESSVSEPSAAKFEASRAADSLTPTASPLTVRTADLNLTAYNFDTAQSSMESILHRFGGHIAELSLNSPAGRARSFSATLRIPAAQLDAALSELRKLGHVDGETQRGEEVTQRHVDLEARLTNARNTEARLTEILKIRTGKLSEVLEVEEQLDKVREQIETTEAEQKVLNNQITLATLQVRVSEVYQQPLTGSSEAPVWTRTRNAAITGLKTAVAGIIAVALWLLEVGPSLLLLAAILFFPARFLFHRLRRH